MLNKMKHLNKRIILVILKSILIILGRIFLRFLKKVIKIGNTLNAKLIDRVDRESLSELTYNVDILPSKYTKFYKLIPEELAAKYKGKLRTVVMIFKHPQIKNSRVEHRMRVDFRSESKAYPIDYNFKKSNSENALNLSIKRIPYQDYPLEGILSRTDAANGKITRSTKIKIDYDYDAEEFIVTQTSPYKLIRISRSYIMTLNKIQPIKTVDKFAIAIQNINLANNKYLRQGSYYTIEDVFGYVISDSTSNDYPGSNLVKEKAYLKYFITSEEDNTAYVELQNKKVNIKYYADFSTGIIKGMSMTTCNKSISEVERITLFTSR